ncbi:hypothetical protein GpartN1_g6924.t1 [Galdieria partita]|uniref:E2 ubiquitin-conjugating enzyme n=1 Tax=Galdieria partita TaxID=83374 RepID=A0A9C7Q282_9RHOD|nr:hypothetical protein GpartN1_g6102.t1 [Galdieria partita]GJQ15133.1 hypothetical protein GpartN1_g6924.t1 [Galdieria partita]
MDRFQSAAWIRVKKELEQLYSNPPTGIKVQTKDDSLHELEAEITGPEDSPYEGGRFLLSIQLPSRYPLEPPQVRFMTPVYHPNIDSSGRICFDALNLPPKGAWRPCLNISSLLVSIRLLLVEANPEDALMADIAEEYRKNYSLFMKKAKESTRQYLIP